MYKPVCRTIGPARFAGAASSIVPQQLQAPRPSRFVLARSEESLVGDLLARDFK